MFGGEPTRPLSRHKLGPVGIITLSWRHPGAGFLQQALVMQRPPADLGQWTHTRVTFPHSIHLTPPRGLQL